MMSASDVAEPLVDGFLKILPALIAAYFGYRLWRQKSNYDRAVDAIRSCWVLSHFCSVLRAQITTNPNATKVVAIDLLNKNLDTLIGMSSTNDLLADLFDIYALWERNLFSGMKIEDAELRRRIESLAKYESVAKSVANVIGQKVEQGDLVNLRLRDL